MANYLTPRTAYSKHYGGFRGVDFSSDHTQVNDSRLAYAVNVFKDYGSSQGQAIETIPGFRRRVVTPDGSEIYGIHHYKTREGYRVYIHAGNKLYFWHNYPENLGVVEVGAFSFIEKEGLGDVPDYEIQIDAKEVKRVEKIDGTVIANTSLEDGVLTLSTNELTGEDRVVVYFIKEPLTSAVFEGMNERKSSSFVFGETMYIIDGKNYICVYGDKVEKAVDNAYIPTTYINIIPSGENADKGKAFEPRNMLSPKFKHTFIGDGTTKTFYMNERDLDSIDEVTLYGEKLKVGEDYTVNEIEGSVTFTEVPKKPEEAQRVALESGTWTINGYGMSPEPLTEISFSQRIELEAVIDNKIVMGDKIHVYISDFGNYLGVVTLYYQGNEVGSFVIGSSPFVLRFTQKTVVSAQFYSWLNKAGEIKGCLPILNGAYVFNDKITPPSKEFDQRVIKCTHGDATSISRDVYRIYYSPERKDLNFYYYDSAGNDGIYSPYSFVNAKWKDNYSKEITFAERQAVDENFYNWFMANASGGADAVTLVAEEEPEIVASFPEGYAGIEITASKAFQDAGDAGKSDTIDTLITGCTISAIYDNRVFFAGNPKAPNRIFWSMLNNPSYVGAYNHVADGVSSVGVTAMLPVADSLLVLKEETRDDGMMYFHTPQMQNDDLYPVVYPSSQGLGGIGCIGAAINFRDDPIFLSRMGVEGISQLSVRYERAVEHRSSLIDAKLTNLDMSHASVTVWNGYLVMLVDGKIFLADSRQPYTHENGNLQYEWYYLEDIGIWDGQYPYYKYSDKDYFVGAELEWCENCGAGQCTCGNKHRVEIKTCDKLGAVNDPDAEGKSDVKVYTTNEYVLCGSFGEKRMFTSAPIHFVVEKTEDEEVAYVCDAQGMTGGVFKPAVEVVSFDDNLYFGTSNGVMCSFNFDKRTEDGDIPPMWYTFDDRIIYSGVATKMDNCGVPHLNKSTVKKSTVIKTKTFTTSAAKIKVRTNRKPYAQIARINSSLFSFDSMDFADFSFTMTEQSIFAVKEKEKKWVEKQYYIYSDEYMKPFALYYVSYQYNITGKYKEG